MRLAPAPVDIDSHGPRSVTCRVRFSWECACMGNRDGRRRRWGEDDRRRLIEERCDRYEADWRALQAPQIEDYLVGVEGEVRTALWLEIVMLDHELRRSNREKPTLSDYRASCPDAVFLLDPSTADLAATAELIPAGGDRGVDLGLTRGAGPLADLAEPAPARGSVRRDRRADGAHGGGARRNDQPDRFARYRGTEAGGPGPRGPARRPGDGAAGLHPGGLRVAREAGPGGHGRRLQGPAEGAQPGRRTEDDQCRQPGRRSACPPVPDRGRSRRRAGPSSDRPDPGERRAPGRALLHHEADRRPEPRGEPGPVPGPAGGDRPTDGADCRGDPPRPPARGLAPRPEAVEHPGGRRAASRT